MTLPIVMIGDSQVSYYKLATEELGLTDEVKGAKVSGGFVFFREFFHVRDGDVEWTKRASQNNFEEAAGVQSLLDCKGRLVLSIGLSAAPFYGTIHNQRLIVGNGETRPLWGYVSRQALEAAIEDLQKYTVSFYRFCLERGLLMAAIAAARPQARHPAVERMGSLVLDLAAAYEAPVRRILAEYGCPIVEPEGVTDSDGFLLEKYWGHDWSHGGIEYGKLVVQELLRLRSASETTAART